MTFGRSTLYYRAAAERAARAVFDRYDIVNDADLRRAVERLAARHLDGGPGQVIPMKQSGSSRWAASGAPAESRLSDPRRRHHQVAHEPAHPAGDRDRSRPEVHGPGHAGPEHDRDEVQQVL